MIARAQSEGLPLSAETCPHYLHFTAETIPDGATAFKCAPPIRSAENREVATNMNAPNVVPIEPKSLHL